MDPFCCQTNSCHFFPPFFYSSLDKGHVADRLGYTKKSIRSEAVIYSVVCCNGRLLVFFQLSLQVTDVNTVKYFVFIALQDWCLSLLRTIMKHDSYH